jgi:hypothetical protein
MSEAGKTNSEKIGLFQIVILILSIIVLGALGADTVFKLPKQISEILQTLDTLVCVLLITDFGIRFYTAESKLAFIKWGGAHGGRPVVAGYIACNAFSIGFQSKVRLSRSKKSLVGVAIIRLSKSPSWGLVVV